MPTGLDRAVAPLSLLDKEDSADAVVESSEGAGGGALWEGFCSCSSLLFLFLLLAALGIFTLSRPTLLSRGLLLSRVSV